MTDFLTKAFFRRNDVVFFPQTQAEAAYIQKRLFEMGISWCAGADISSLAECVAQGVSVSKGYITYGIDDTKRYIAREAVDFRGATPADWATLSVALPAQKTTLGAARVLEAPKIAFARSAESVRVSPSARPPAPRSLASRLESLQRELADLRAAQARCEDKLDRLLDAKTGAAARPRRRT